MIGPAIPVLDGANAQARLLARFGRFGRFGRRCGHARDDNSADVSPGAAT